jgi:hypothetical protein
MGVRIRVWMGTLALVLLSNVVVVPSSEAMRDHCNDCGSSCRMDYAPGWSDCGGAPAGCMRVTVCP